MKINTKLLIYVILSAIIGIISAFVLNNYIVPALDGDTLDIIAKIFYEDSVEKIGLEETIQLKYTRTSNILVIIFMILCGVSSLSTHSDIHDNIGSSIMWCGVHTCWHALKLYIWGIKLGHAIGETEIVNLALDMIDFHPIRLVLIYLIFGMFISSILEQFIDIFDIDNDSIIIKKEPTPSNDTNNTTNESQKSVSLEKDDK